MAATMSTWYVKLMGKAFAQRNETFETTEDLAGVIGIDPRWDDAVELMWAAAHAYHDAGGRFSDREERDYFPETYPYEDINEQGFYE